MIKQLRKQRYFLIKGLQILGEMEQVESLFTGIDDEYLKEINNKLKIEYAETMATLAGELASVGKITDIAHEEINY